MTLRFSRRIRAFFLSIIIACTSCTAFRTFQSKRTFALPQITMISHETPIWDPVEQIYVGGVVPENAAVEDMIKAAQGTLRLFGYGSLCWNPGSGALAHESVKHTLGRARGYRRCWAQRSTDHRGNPRFPGIVCTLLKDEEFRHFRQESDEESLTEGLLYEVPPNLVEECLAELDFREKGGYARDIIQVVEDESHEKVQALLYRGTPDNPAFWPKALTHLPYAAAVMSVAVGPSGENKVYLERLDHFLEGAANPGTLEKFDDTFALHALAKKLCDYELFFFFGAGSNKYNQLLLAGGRSNFDSQDANALVELVAAVASDNQRDLAVKVFAGGGHSAMLTRSGRMYLFGWNDDFQLGRSLEASGHDRSDPEGGLGVTVLRKLEIPVQDAALGFSHTLVIEKGTGRLFAFGSNEHGQVDPTDEADRIATPRPPDILLDECIVRVAAGLFHSAAVTREGDVVTFGASKSGQTLPRAGDGVDGRWRPPDGAKAVKVACGRHHTVILDDQGRVWSFGENRYGQLGRSSEGGASPQLVEMSNQLNVVDIECGWSHTTAITRNKDGSLQVFGWGRNDRGQLGTGSDEQVVRPRRLFADKVVHSLSCGSESTVLLDDSDQLWWCGWNDHLSESHEHALNLTLLRGARIVRAPGYPDDAGTCLAVGGAHILAMKVDPL